jgi:hypothetical protein
MGSFSHKNLKFQTNDYNNNNSTNFGGTNVNYDHIYTPKPRDLINK